MGAEGFDLSALSSISPEAISSAIGQISQHPEILSVIGSVLGGQTGGGEPSQDKSDATAFAPVSASPSELHQKSSDVLGAFAPILSAIGGNVKKSPKDAHRDALLCALKPYLNEGRQSFIDNVMKLSQFGDLFKLIK